MFDLVHIGAYLIIINKEILKYLRMRTSLNFGDALLFIFFIFFLGIHCSHGWNDGKVKE
jgi:hypothetical protein